ncbi:MAG: hypothetical protein R3E32_28015 [Chitinophagales bacterium]
MNGRAYISFFICCLLCYLLFRIAFMHSQWNHNFTIGYDVSGYYAYLPAHFIYDDLEQLKYMEDICKRYTSVSDNWSVAANGHKVQKYPIGMAILYAPAFGVAHFFADKWGFPQDGYSFPYQYFLSLYSVLFACLGLWLLRTCLLYYFKDLTVGIVLAIIVLATNYIVYAGLSAAMTHGYLFTLYALLIWLTILWHQQQKWGLAASIGLLYGLMVIVRPTEVIAILIPLLWGIDSRKAMKAKAQLVWQSKGQVALLTVCTIAVGMIQLLYWKKISGDWFYYSYDDQGFSFLSPYLMDGLFSYRKGWLIYTPVMIFALAGFWQLFKKTNQVFWACLVFVVMNVYIVYSWDIWWYGGSVGSRAVVQSYAILAFPFAAFVAWIMEQKKRALLIAWAAIVLVFADLNLMQTWQSHSAGGGWNGEYMTRAYYFSIIGSTQIKQENRKYLDVGRRIRDTRGMTFRQLYFEDFETPKDSNIVRIQDQKFEGNYAAIVNKDHPHAPYFEVPLTDIQPTSKAWIRAGVQIFFMDAEWNEWQMTSLVIEFWRGEELIESRPMRLHWLTDGWKWYHAYFERPLPRKMRENIQPNDRLKVYVLNQGSEKKLYIDNFAVELIEP